MPKEYSGVRNKLNFKLQVMSHTRKQKGKKRKKKRVYCVLSRNLSRKFHLTLPRKNLTEEGIAQ